MGGVTVLQLWVSLVFLCGSCLASPLGKDFVTAFMQNYKLSYSRAQFQLIITGYSPSTTVTISMNKSSFKQVLTVDERTTVTVDIPANAELDGVSKSSNVIIIKSDKDVSVLALNSKALSADTAIVYPVEDLGTDYYVVTPLNGPHDAFKQFAVVSSQEETNVEIYLKGAVAFQEKLYNAGSKLTVTLEPYSALQLLSKDDLSGTHVLSDKAVAVLSGHTCAWKNARCNHVYEQLLPVTEWGTSFIIPPIYLQPKSDIIFVAAANDNTKIEYQIDEKKLSQTLTKGQVIPLDVPVRKAIYLTASSGIQVLFFCTGWQDRLTNIFDPFLMTIPSIDKYCSSYIIYGQQDFDNFGTLVVKTTDTSKVTVNKGPIGDLTWNNIPGTEYSWATQRLGRGFSTRLTENPSQFLLLSFGFANMNGYGSPATCIEGNKDSGSSCSTVKCRAKEKCKMVNGKPVCIPDSEAYCHAVGDPHYRTFDGRFYDFQGTCTYTVAKTCNDKSLPYFNIEAKNENRGNTRVAFVSYVNVEVYDYTISLVRYETGFVRVNNQRQRLPMSLNGGQVLLYQSGGSVVIETDFSLKVFYDWNSILKVYISSSFFESVCGLCGNYNGNPSDDLVTPAGVQAPDLVEFGKSWKVEDGDRFCWHNCNGECKTCPLEMQRLYSNEDSCGLLSLPHGPFHQCHSIIDPKPYIDNCVYDLCMNAGSKQILCQSLKAYVDACQRSKAEIGEWRSLSECPMQCPENSQYKLCAKSCPATCNDDATPTTCSDICVESCQCKDGYVLDEGKCKPKSSCGCIYEGRLYAPNEKFWGDNKCEKQCTCNPSTNKVECKSTHCKSSEQCLVKNGIQDCYPVSYGTCSAEGDPHYFTFDGARYDFQGTCIYQFVGLCKKTEGLVDFQVNVLNDFQGSKVVSYTNVVNVKLCNLDISIDRMYPNKILINGLLTNLPYIIDNGKLSVYKQGFHAVLQTSFGLRVSYNYAGHVSVTLPSTYAGAVCGLCGNFDGDKKNDLMMKNNQIASKTVVFGNSWKVKNLPGCYEEDKGDCPKLVELELWHNNNKNGCRILKDKTGPFRECHAKIDPQEHFQSCVYDACFYEGRQYVLCNVISGYATLCQKAGATIYPWRSKTFCNPTCPKNSHYEVCATACEPTCQSLSPPLGCNPEGCSEGCQCDDGFILSGGDCVLISQCGCRYENKYYKLGEVFYPGGFCNQKCVCTASGAVECIAFNCGANEECTVVNGVQKCQPVGSAQCSAAGDPHYMSFDGVPFDFQGTCTYTLTKTITNKENLEPFAVNVKNEKWGNGLVAVTKMVSVDVYGYNFILQYGVHGKVLINGVYRNIPINLEDAKIWVYQNGVRLSIATDFGFQVSYDLAYHVMVTVPANYKNQLGGLCGNYNGDKKDDFQLPDKRVTTDATVFGSSWKVQIPGVSCEDGCGGAGNPCPSCDEKKKEIFKTENYCGFLKKANGPLSACYDTINPDPYFNNCVFDLCAGAGSGDILCHSIQSYVGACQAADVKIQPWRTETFCPMKCPANSKYKIEADMCNNLCIAINTPGQCLSFPEGCECDDDFFFDGKGCVPVDKCGCFHEGKYYEPDVTVLSDDCKQACTCTSGAGFICEDTSCAADELCQNKDGVIKCISKAPTCSTVKCRTKEKCKMENGKPVCIPDSAAYCHAVGDPHYRTFDGRFYDFQGTCTYTVAKTCNDKSLPYFNIEAKNENRGSTRVAFVSYVNIEVYDYTISLVRYETGFVRVNNQRQRLPMSLNDGQLRLYQSGGSVVIETDFSLFVYYDWNSILKIDISSSFYESVCGLCGNYNGNPSDDLITPTGLQAPDLVEFGKSWKVEDGDRFCWHNCKGECKTCPLEMQRLYSAEDSCGLLSLVDGPFHKCHSLIDPQPYVDNCVYDLCMNAGAKQILCQSLKTYADACQRSKVEIKEWRSLSGCAMQCPENSQYKLCAKSCPATCNDDATPAICSDICVESCQCKDGYVLDEGKCKPKSSCGCVYEGRLYAPKEKFWGDNKCEKQCTCNPSTKKVECKSTHCKSSEQCLVKNGIQDCYPVSYGTCSAEGDPHYFTFDGARFDFQGTCIYQLVGLCKKTEGLVDFQINVMNDFQGSKVVSYTNVVNVKLCNLDISIDRMYPNKILINDSLTNLPYIIDNGKLSIYKQGFYAVLQTSFGLRVSYNYAGHVSVTLPSTYAGAVCGLCGNFDGDKTNDLMMKNNQIASKPVVFGNSWKVKNLPGCYEEDKGDCPKLAELELWHNNNKNGCGILKDKTGPFRECHAKIDPQEYFKSCVYDACFYEGRQYVICNAISGYATLCQKAGATVYPWRSITFCNPTCPKNSHYEVCAAACEPTCQSLSPPLGCNPEGCSEGCQCDDGFILSGGDCVLISQCGCRYENKYYKLGEVFYPGGLCNQKCVCTAGGMVQCSAYNCGANEECTVVNGVQKCQPVGSAQCSAAGDPHYMSFDGVPFDFQGTCTYTLTKTITNKENLEPFAVNVKNEKWGNGLVAVTKMVSVDVYGYNFILQYGVQGKLLINGVYRNIPINLEDAKIWVYKNSLRLSIATDFGFQVSYDLAYHVMVTVPANYKNQLGGLCGNYNGDKNDDFQLPDKRVTTDATVFGSSWKVQIPGVSCEDGCGGAGNPCPSCDEKKKEIFKTENYCGFLKKAKGPLSACYDTINPDPYFNNCVFDLCAGAGSEDILCHSIQSYVGACQAADVKIQPWRTETFCPMKCPANSKYKIEADMCNNLCIAINTPGQCLSFPEGCECDDDFFFDGKGCVPVDKCGCFHEGKYYEPDVTVLSDDCKQACTCTSGAGFICEDTSCAADELCQNKDGVIKCISKAPTCSTVKCRTKEKCKMENGKPVCIPDSEAYCHAVGDPHYRTFDGRFYDFQGTCTYTVAKTCNDKSLPYFNIEAKNENRGSTRVAFVSYVNIEVYDYTISLVRYETGFVRVNNQRQRLPMSLNDGQLRLYQSGGSVVIETDFSLFVYYDWNSILKIDISSSFYESICGLCGNYNGNPSDDLITPTGVQAPNLVEFGKSWKVEDGDRFCWHNCNGECKTCPLEMQQLYSAEDSCGLLSLVDGPFHKCHSLIDPKPYVDNCVYDLCMNAGAKQILCQSLKTYADACQRSKVEIKEWRSLSGCAMQCPENSQYKLCAKSCPATCNDDATPAICSDICVESCQCKDGYVLDEGKCKPKSSCGCVYEGRLYASKEKFWGDNKCEKQCTCNPSTKKVECKSTHCKSSEQCLVKNGIQDCYPVSYGTCSAEGDPHYFTFDGARFDFQGTCIYQLVGLCKKTEGLVDFQINVMNDFQGSKVVSYTNVVNVKLCNLDISIDRMYPNKILINDSLTNLPYIIDNGKLSIYKQGFYAVLQTSFGLRVSYNYAGHVSVTLPSTYAGAVCGLCGNFDGDKKNDLMMKNNQIASKPVIFGNSWKVKNLPGCYEEDKGDCPKLAELELWHNNNKNGCGILKDKTGPFRECHAKIDPQEYFKSCVYDACFYEGRQYVTCNAISGYATLCQKAGATVYPWRSKTFCNPTCPKNSHYEVCAAACEPTCQSLSPPLGCNPEGCSEGCQCDDGFILSGGDCVLISQCGCRYENKYYKLGEVFYPGRLCNHKCVCTAGGMVQCSAYNCGANEECTVVNGVQKCQPVGSAQCSAAGDPHYMSFDGVPFDFQGTCTYTLTKTITNKENLEPFAVNVKNEKWGNGLVAVTKMVSVDVYGYNFILQYGVQGKLLINGVYRNIPINLEDAKIWVYKNGLRLSIATDFGFQVSYDLAYHVMVTVPANYKNQLGGLCGNYNGDKNDDFQLPDKRITTDATVFGSSWKVQIPGVSCEDGCGGAGNPCPSCDEKKKEIFKTENYCGFLKKANGPLSACYDTINPDPYFNNCVFDLCAGAGSEDILCHSIQSYVGACQAADVKIQPWRTETFCPMKCPANSKYKIEADMCNNLCIAINTPGQCLSFPEGCECDDDFFFDGKGCVPVDKCGCFHEGKYYEPNVTVLFDDCKQACTCSVDGAVTCEDTGCAADELCQNKDGVVKCINKDPCKSIKCRAKETCKVQDGNPVCVPDFTGTCWAWGDPHYHTYDGYNYDFQGTCTYILSKYDGTDNGLVPFSIEEKNDNRGNQAVSFVRTVNIYIYGYKITIMKGEFGKVRVNDVITNLPVTLLDGKISASISGLNAVVRTDFGLQVTYEYNWHVVITLSSSYYGLTGGLCGNFNQNLKDELLTSDNKVVMSIVDWARSWKVNDRDLFCFDSCPGLNCPTCDDAKKNLYGGDKKCGLISKVTNGPFRECHPKVNPDNFFDNCLYDVCINGGANQFLCQALGAYSSTCRKQGVKVYDWRTSSGCVLPCPANSHYEFCGNACPATCTDRTAPSQCTDNCVETCQCNDGFVLSGDKCVPTSSCGCFFNGAYYQANEEFWADDNCRKLCKCDPSVGFVVCKETSCKASERCMVSNGVRGCHPLSYSTCEGSGDPHYTTFDGKRFDFMGTCVYQLVGVTSSDSSLTPFNVTVQNNNRGGNKAVSYTKVVTLEVYDTVFTLSMDYQHRILVDGVVTSLPLYFKTNQVVAYVSGSYGVIKTDFDITVKFDWSSHVAVTIPSTYANAIGGLCGNNNKNPNDDFNMRDGKAAPTAVQFGNSWKVADVPGCTPECTGTCPACSEAEKNNYNSDNHCGLITKSNGPFALCLSVVSPTPYFNDCVFDACQYKGHPTSFCKAIGLYVAACQAAGVKLQEWRSSSFCGMSCPVNSHYELCGNSCPVTCYGLSPPTGCDGLCKEACYCDDGYIMSGHKCVPIANCGCVYQDKYYQKDEVFYPQGHCSQKCQCGADGIVTCKSEACRPEEECKLVNGVWGCHAKEIGRCVASGDPHYISFDGLKFDFQGTCTYILSKVEVEDLRLANFSVVVENERYGNSKVAVTRLVVIYVYGYTVAIERNMRSKVKVNGEFVKLPWTTEDHSIIVNQEGANVVLQTNFGLNVLYDTVYHVVLNVPGTYGGKLGGLCGNFNGNNKDEFQLPNREVAKNVNEFGASWKVSIAGAKCSDGCEDGGCPVCDDAKLQPYKSMSSCGMITNPAGPFQACHAKINPLEYFNHCIYDSCAVEGKDDILCKSLQAYTAACQAVGITVGSWRNANFCPMSCPANSHYELCTRTCQQTCAGLLAPMRCTDRCFEGCECDTGFILDGDTCVTMDKCGCAYNGRYMSDGESFISADCSQQCKCQAGGVTCTALSCGAKERCGLVNGVRGCFKTEAECTINLQKMITFDGFLGGPIRNGPVEVASLCNSDSPKWFRVVADIQTCAKVPVSVARLYIFVPGGLVTISKNKDVWVNGQASNLPITTGTLTASAKDTTVIVQIGADLRIELSNGGNLSLQVSEALSEVVCGACGNFNGDSSDDLRSPDGKVVSGIVQLIQAWTASDFSSCEA